MNPSLFLDFIAHALGCDRPSLPPGPPFPSWPAGDTPAMRRARCAAAIASVGGVVQAAKTAAVALGLFT